MSANFWEGQYSQGHQLNIWPITSVVSAVYRSKTSGLPCEFALELGSGAGNNLVFLAGVFEKVVGLEASQTACEVSRERLRTLKNAMVVHQSFDKPFQIGARKPDFVLDRASLCHSRRQNMEQALALVASCLKSGGLFYSEGFFDVSEEEKEGRIPISRHGEFTPVSTGEFTSLLGALDFTILEATEDHTWSVFPERRIEHKTRRVLARRN